MNKTVEVILRESMKLPETDRAHLIDELLMSLDIGKEEDVDAAWALEIEKRSLELSKGTVQATAWGEVKKIANKRVYGTNKN